MSIRERLMALKGQKIILTHSTTGSGVYIWHVESRQYGDYNTDTMLDVEEDCFVVEGICGQSVYPVSMVMGIHDYLPSL